MDSTSEYHKLTLSFDSIKFIDDLPKVSLCFTQLLCSSEVSLLNIKVSTKV